MTPRITKAISTFTFSVFLYVFLQDSGFLAWTFKPAWYKYAWGFGIAAFAYIAYKPKDAVISESKS